MTVGLIAVAIIILLIIINALLLLRIMKLKKQLKSRVNISAYVKDKIRIIILTIVGLYFTSLKNGIVL